LALYLSVLIGMLGKKVIITAIYNDDKDSFIYNLNSDSLTIKNIKDIKAI
jgi:hypothetical protein